MMKAAALLLLFLMLGISGCGSDGRLRSASEPESSLKSNSTARSRARIHTELAAQYFQHQNMSVALDEIRISLNHDRDYAPAYNMRGLIQMHLRENDAAEESFRRALSLAENDPEVNNNYGWFLCETKREKGSIAYFAAAFKNTLYQTPEKSYINAGICSMRIDDLAAAEDYFMKAMRTGRNAPGAMLPLAKLHYRKGDYRESRRLVLEFNRQIEPTAESLWLALRIERKLGDRVSEGSYTSQLRRKFPDSQEADELRRGKFE